MKILLIEDRVETSEFLAQSLRQLIPNVEVTVAAHAASAERLFLDNHYDLTILDLELPARADDPSPNIAHGERLLAMFRERVPGAAICVLTAHGTMQHANAAFTGKPVLDIFGDPKIPTLCFIKKDEMRTAVNHARSIADLLARFDAVDVRVEPISAQDPIELRIFQRYAVFFGATRVVARRFGSGLSSAKAFSVKLFDADGVTKALLAIKIATLEKTLLELQKYEQFVAPLLSPDALAPLVSSPVLYGVNAAVAYRLLDSRALTLYRLTESRPREAARAIEIVERTESYWVPSTAPKQVTIADLRRALVGDDDLSPEQRELVAKYTSFESRQIRVRVGVQHGDLHGENILCSAEGDATLIDYADVARIAVPADPVMLELSFVFHPSAAELRKTWPSISDLANWKDIDAFTQGCPFAVVIRRCREWAGRLMEPVGDDGLAACVYAYAVWQLGFNPSRKGEIYALIGAVAQDP